MMSKRQNFKDMNMYVVASIHWIATVTKEEVTYIITDYIEVGVTKVEDGLYTAISALAKEHEIKFPDGRPFKIEFEYDRSSIMSPSVQKWYDEGGFFSMPSNPYEMSWCYIKGADDELRNTAQDGWRQDQRFFTATTMANRFGKQLRENGVDVRDPKQRANFLKLIGFTRCIQPATRRLMLNPMELMKMSFDYKRFSMYKVDPSMFFGSGVMDGTSIMDQNNPYQQMMMMQQMMSMMGNNPASNPEPSSPQQPADNNSGFGDMMSQMYSMSMMSAMLGGNQG